MDVKRRMMLVASAAAGAGLVSTARAQEVDEKDPPALALGYVSNAAKADAKKFPKYAVGQSCGSCALFQAAAGDPVGKCPIFGGKQVRAEAWCNAWAKRG